MKEYLIFITRSSVSLTDRDIWDKEIDNSYLFLNCKKKNGQKKYSVFFGRY